MSDVSVRATVEGFEEGQRSVKALGDEFKRLEEQAKAPIKSLEDLDRALNSIQELQKKGAITSIEAERRSAALGSQFSALTDIIDGTGSKFSELGKAAAIAAGDAAGLGGVRRAAEKTGDAMESAGVAIGGATALIGVALVAGVYKAVSSIAEAVGATRELGSEFHNLSQRTGLSVEALSGYRVIAEVGGLSTENFAVSLERFNRKIAAAQKGTEDGTSAFERMGISIYDSNGNLKDTDTLLGEVAEKFAGYEDGANKTALAVELFDRAGTRLIPTLNKGAEGLAQMKEEARLAGIVMSGETADAADKLNENMAVLESYGQGFWQGVASPIIDGLAKVTTAMREARKEGDGFFGSLLAGMRRAWSETFFDSTTDKLNDVNKQIALTQSSIAQMEAGKAKGRGVDPGTLAASYSRLQELYRQQGMLEGTQEAEAPGAFGGAKGKAPPPIAKPKKAKDVKSMEELDLGLDAALAASLEAEREYYRELKNLGQVSELDYRRMLDQQMDDTQEGTRERMGVEKAWKAFQDERNKEYLKGDAALTRTIVANTRERVAGEKAASAEALQVLREEYRERARAIQMDASLNASEKNQAMQDLADTLEAHKSTQSSKREVDDLERQIRQQGRDIEQREIQAFYAGIKSTVSANLFDLVKGTKDLGEAVKGVFTGIFDSILRKATDFVADKALDYVLVLLGLKEGKASGKGAEGLLAPVFSAFGSLGTFVGSAMDSIGSVISGMLGGVGSGVEGTMSGVGESVGSMASSVWGFLSELGTSAWNIFSSMGSGLMDIISSVVSGAGNLISGLTGGAGNAIGSLVTSVGSAFSGIGSTISSVIGAITGGTSAAALETLGVGLATGEAVGVGAGAAAAGTGAGVFGSGAMAVLGPIGLFVGMAAALGAFSGGDNIIYGPGAMYPPGTPEYEAFMAMQALQQSWAVHGLAATGVDRLVTSPTVFVAGEAGPERVTVSPLSGAARHGMGGGGGVNFNAPVIMDYYTMRQFLRGLEKYSQ